jgi:hypothetical protein
MFEIMTTNSLTSSFSIIFTLKELPFLLKFLNMHSFYVVSFISIMETNLMLLVSILFFLEFVSFLLHFHIVLSHCQTSFSNQIYFRIYCLQFIYTTLNFNLQMCLKLFQGCLLNATFSFSVYFKMAKVLINNPPLEVNQELWYPNH